MDDSNEERFFVLTDEVIAETIGLFQRTRAPAPRMVLARFMVEFLTKHKVSQTTYDQVFRITLTDNLYSAYALSIFRYASRHLIAQYRLVLLRRASWRDVEQVAEFTGIPTTREEVYLMCKVLGVHQTDNNVRAEFRKYIALHPALSGAERSVAAIYVLDIALTKEK